MIEPRNEIPAMLAAAVSLAGITAAGRPTTMTVALASYAVGIATYFLLKRASWLWAGLANPDRTPRAWISWGLPALLAGWAVLLRWNGFLHHL